MESTLEIIGNYINIEYLLEATSLAISLGALVVGVIVTIKVARIQNGVTLYTERRKYYHRCFLPYTALTFYIEKQWGNECYKLNEVLCFMAKDDYINQIHIEYMARKLECENIEKIAFYQKAENYVDYKCEYLRERISMLFPKNNVQTEKIIKMYQDIILEKECSGSDVIELLESVKIELDKMKKQLKV